MTAIAPGSIIEGNDDGFGPAIHLWTAPDDSLTSDSTTWIGSCVRHATVLAVSSPEWVLLLDADGRVGWACVRGNVDSGSASVTVVLP